MQRHHLLFHISSHKGTSRTHRLDHLHLFTRVLNRSHYPHYCKWILTLQLEHRYRRMLEFRHQLQCSRQSAHHLHTNKHHLNRWKCTRLGKYLGNHHFHQEQCGRRPPRIHVQTRNLHIRDPCLIQPLHICSSPLRQEHLLHRHRNRIRH